MKEPDEVEEINWLNDINIKSPDQILDIYRPVYLILKEYVERYPGNKCFLCNKPLDDIKKIKHHLIRHHFSLHPSKRRIFEDLRINVCTECHNRKININIDDANGFLATLPFSNHISKQVDDWRKVGALKSLFDPNFQSKPSWEKSYFFNLHTLTDLSNEYHQKKVLEIKAEKEKINQSLSRIEAICFETEYHIADNFIREIERLRSIIFTEENVLKNKLSFYLDSKYKRINMFNPSSDSYAEQIVILLSEKMDIPTLKRCVEIMESDTSYVPMTGALDFKLESHLYLFTEFMNKHPEFKEKAKMLLSKKS